MLESNSLVATLGGQPQIITFTLDLLLARGESIDQVVIVYLASGSRYRQAYRRLVGEFIADRYAGRPCHLRRVPVSGLKNTPGETTLEEVRTPQEVEAVRDTFYTLLSDLKTQGQRIHLSLSGGRRIMALTALAAAMQYLTPADKVYHIYTPPGLLEQALEGAIMHAPPEAGVQLIDVPFVPWAAYFPGLHPLLERPSQEAGGFPPPWMDAGERARCRQVWEALTPRQQETLRLLSKGLTRAQAADRMGIAVTTVDSHLKAITGACLSFWEPENGQRLNLAFLRERFGLYLTLLEKV